MWLGFTHMDPGHTRKENARPQSSRVTAADTAAAAAADTVAETAAAAATATATATAAVAAATGSCAIFEPHRPIR